MDFKRTNWKNNDPSTPLSAANMNKIEDAIEGLIDEIDISREKEEALANSLAHLRENIDTNANVVQTFIGTAAQYQTAYDEGKIEVGCLVFILDDEDVVEEETTSTSAKLGEAILGYMILGN